MSYGEEPTNKPLSDVAQMGIKESLGRACLETGRTIIFGVLTADTLEQAIDRAGAKGGNKGWDAALAAIELADLQKNISGKMNTH